DGCRGEAILQTLESRLETNGSRGLAELMVDQGRRPPSCFQPSRDKHGAPLCHWGGGGPARSIGGANSKPCIHDGVGLFRDGTRYSAARERDLQATTDKLYSLIMWEKRLSRIGLSWLPLRSDSRRLATVGVRHRGAGPRLLGGGFCSSSSLLRRSWRHA